MLATLDSVDRDSVQARFLSDRRYKEIELKQLIEIMKSIEGAAYAGRCSITTSISITERNKEELMSRGYFLHSELNAPYSSFKPYTTVSW